MIEISKLRVHSAGRVALEVDSLIVDKGEVVAVIGPADSGREILFDLLIGRTRPSTGTVRLAGLDPERESDQFSRKVGVLFQEDGLYKHQSLLANLIFTCQLYGWPGPYLPREIAPWFAAQAGLWACHLACAAGPAAVRSIPAL